MTASLELAGFTVGVTSARRADELGTLLERRGARVLHGPALRIVPLADDTELRRATEECIQAPPDVVVATTGIGFRGWAEAAEGWGVGEDLRSALHGARMLARGPKARGAMRAAGLPDPWSPESESSAGVLEMLLSEPLAGRRVAVQLHGRPLPEFTAALRAAGAHVVELPVYRWSAPTDVTGLENLLDAACAHELDAVTFTSAPAAGNLLALAGERGRLDRLVSALRGPVLAACVGPATAAPLAEHRIAVVMPERYRLGGLVRALCESLPARARVLPVAGRRLQLRGHAAVVDGQLKPLSPSAKTLLRALMEQPGRVIARRDLAGTLNAGQPAQRALDEHAVEQAIARLRASLGAPELVQTVIKRGYRIPLEPTEDQAPCARPRP
ncbi:uroporphyrinogen-III synthase [Saccharopolyspora erythraea]|uniref:uroporphyrinogen-III synthase n=1 Tax=Saccharopolyspora erythraea TaxID=1836 RepID=UPI001BA8A636|nr:uroporphyrinogen-III synthase [Saccharopolyspora erythraea]QUH02772.1 uroporphyrinogen-III synthase [Saccharopolyspora erythraea]